MIVGGHGCHTALHFGVKAKENQDKVTTLYWLPKLHKNPIKQGLLLILKGVKKVRSAIKLLSYYFSYYVSNDIHVTGIL